MRKSAPSAEGGIDLRHMLDEGRKVELLLGVGDGLAVALSLKNGRLQCEVERTPGSKAPLPELRSIEQAIREYLKQKGMPELRSISVEVRH